MRAPEHSSVVPNPDRAKLYLDFDCFFASVEQHFNPDLRGKPVGVVPLDVPGTGCIAISREAKALGVPSGASIVKAREACPDMIFVVARPDAYVRLHHRVLHAIETCLPIARVRSIDEVVCDLLPSESAAALTLARGIKFALRERIGKSLTCSIGLGQTELLAKIAAEADKPDGLVVLDAAMLPDAIAEMPLADIPGISKGIESRLSKANIRNVEQLWAMGAKQCRALWGSIEGERFWNALHGYPYERPDTEKRMFGHSRMLPLDWRTPDKVRDCARQLLLSAARRLRREELRASKLTLSARGGGFRGEARSKSDTMRWSAEIVFDPAHDDKALLAALNDAYTRYTDQVGFAPRLVSVVLHGLYSSDEPQGDLFAASNNMAKASRQRSERLSFALDSLRAKHGPAAASMGVQEAIPGGYLGAKIAFGRIPDEADFAETTEDGDTHFATM